MACKIEIEKTINKSIDKVLPNRGANFPETQAKGIRDNLNTIWASPISKVASADVPSRYNVVINNLTPAINKEYDAQVSAEKAFEENIDFFREDAAVREEGRRISEEQMVTDRTVNSIIENEMGEEYWKELYGQGGLTHSEEFDSVNIPTIPNKYKPDFNNVYHGTSTYEIDSKGNLILTPSKNFSDATTSISFTQVPVVAQDYMLRKKGNIIIKIENSALDNKYDIESAEEIAINGNKLFVVPEGQYTIITVPTLAEKMRKKYEGEVAQRAQRIREQSNSDLDLLDTFFSERINAANYSELQEYERGSEMDHAPDWYVPDEYLESRAARKVYEDISKKINKPWVINALAEKLIEKIKNRGEPIDYIEGELEDLSNYGGSGAPHQSTLFEELLNEIGLSTFDNKTEKQKKEYSDLVDAIEAKVKAKEKESIAFYKSAREVKLREEQARIKEKNDRQWEEIVNSPEYEEAKFAEEKQRTQAEREGAFAPPVSPEEVSYQFRAVNNLTKNLAKANQWLKQMGNTDAFWNKIQQDLQIPKDQVELLRNSPGATIEEKLASFAANYSYAVEVKTAEITEKEFKPEETITEEEYNSINAKVKMEKTIDGFQYLKTTKEGFYYEKHKLGKEVSYTKSIMAIETIPAKHYDYLTVPGGTNYREQEIATPNITPAIEGHAAFATDKGIGWFRSDEQISKHEDKFAWAIKEETGENPSSEVRRILEVQSDLFQKMRGKEDLITRQPSPGGGVLLEKEEFIDVSEDEYLDAARGGEEKVKIGFGVKQYGYDKVYEYKGFYYTETSRSSYGKIPVDYFERKKDAPENQFLQLLNKSNNWITFFIKSIIQDSAKKGYETVLFPTGNTASKVEGHETLEGFKRDKEDKIGRLEEKFKDLSDLRVVPERKDFFGKLQDVFLIKDSEGFTPRSRYITLNRPFVSKEEAQNEIDNETEKVVREIDQLKKEVERVEKEGLAALAPVYNFYENVVASVLKKQGFNPKQITDEHGNTWNEVTVTPEATGPIMLQLAEQELTPTEPNQKERQQNRKTSSIPQTASPATLAKIRDLLKRIGVTVTGADKIIVGGVAMNANAVAVTMQKLIQVVNGKEADALPEEAMHFVVEILEQKDPALFNKLMKEVNQYQMYQNVLRDYGTHPLYQTKDGKPDIRKLKKEAIAKVLVDTIISQSESSREKPELIKQAQGWWDTLIEFIKGIFLESGFDTAAMEILSGKDIGTADDITGGHTYLQKSPQDQVFDNIRALHNRIEKLPVKNSEGGEEEKYFIDGVEIKWRVSNVTKTWYDKLNAENALTDSDFQKAINTLKADKGTDGHKDLEYAFSRFVDEDGNLRDIYLDDSAHQSFLNPYDREMYNKLRDNLRERLESYPKGTRFMSEVTIYNGVDIAGTIDFLAIMPDGKTDILDWKFKALDTDFYEDIPWYNVQAWNRQMGLYKTILQNNYGIKATDFRNTMMVPIRAHYTKPDAAKGIYPRLDKLEIGNVDVKKITEDYLIPVGLESQKTGIRRLDRLLEKLNALHAKLSEQKVSPDERANKNEQLNALYKAIRHLQMKQNIEPLLLQAKTLNKQMEMIMDKYNNTFAGKSKEDFTPLQINAFAKEIHMAEEVLDSYQELNSELRFMFEGKTLTAEEKELRDELRDVVEDVRDYKSSISEMYTDFTTEFIGGTSTPEKVVKGLTRWFGTTATIQLKALEDLYKKANRAVFLTAQDTFKEVERLTGIKTKYMDWAKSKGFDNKNMFDIIKKEGTNELIDEFKPEFYTELNKKTQNKDYAWVKDNIDEAAYKDHLEEKLQEELDRIENKPYGGTPEQVEYFKQRDISKAEAKYSISTPTSVGWLLYNELRKFPKKDTWESDQWKELHKPGNEPALEFYKYIIERNEAYAKIGYISNPNARKFLPWVRKSFVENIIFDGNVAIGEQFLRNISLDESDIGYGKIDPISGNPIASLPKYFTTEVENASTDLFKTMAMYNEMAIKFGYMAEIEDQGRALIRLEKNKKALATSVFGRTEKDEFGELKVNPNNVENSKLVEDMVKAIIYQQKYLESESFDQLLGTLGGFGKTLNSKLGMNIFPENLKGRKVSINKTINTINNIFQVKTLGLNFLSSTSNFFGGTANSFINSGKYFTKTDFIKAEMWLLANKMGGPEQQMLLAGMDYFMPFVENYNRDAAKKLSLTKLDGEAVQDYLMVLMRTGDRAVQAANFVAFFKNSIIQDGKVINTREYLRSTPEYVDMYAGDQAERDARAAKFEEDVIKLNEAQGLSKVGQVVDGKLVLPGVEQSDDSVISLRRQVHAFTNDALGSASEENKRLINMSVYGNSFMVFKNWIPRLVDVRMGNMKYNAASDAYEWGRTRMVAKIIGDSVMQKSFNLINSLKANDKGIDYLRGLYEKQRTEYENETGKTLEMTEAQFIDLVRQNIKAQIADLIFYLSLSALFFAAKALAPDDDDEDPAVKNRYKYMLKMTDKLKDELGYFYDPTSLLTLAKSGLLPSVGLLTDYGKMIGHTYLELYGLAFKDDEYVEDNKAIKYWMRSFPIATQMASLMPMFAPDLAKDLGIKMQGQYGFR